MPLPDQKARDRFALETGQNFSVIAPAGVGKTTAIAHRVAQIARHDARALSGRGAPLLPRLVVVTYTRKAADELRSRARAEIVQAGLSPRVFGLFNEAYFGTIHSFCIELLRRFGPLAGLPARFTIEPDDTALRLAFQRDTSDVAAFLPEDARAAWRCFGNAEKIWPLVWNCPQGAKPSVPTQCPKLNLDELFSFKRSKKNQKAEDNMHRAHERLRRWRDADGEARALGVPEVSGGGEEFEALWNNTFQPVREWLAACAAYAAVGLAETFAKFKEQRGCLGYDDLAPAALRLLRNPVVAERIHAREFSVVLDEAQDTDPAQFAVLLGVAQPVGAPGLWVEGGGAPPAPGRFSMVGDPQQSIYRRANVGVYWDLHEKLQQNRAAEALEFTVTLRCDSAIVASVNQRGPDLLHGRAGQAKFVPLQARPAAGSGGVWRLPVTWAQNISGKPNVSQLIQAEAQVLARWLAHAGFAGVGADGWGKVAVLAPRRDWLEVVELELRAAGIEPQLHAGDRTPGANPARTWLGALLGVLADPGDDFEIIGVLREIFGISDDELFHWCRERTISRSLAAALNLLEHLRRDVAGKPLREAVATAANSVRLRERIAVFPEQPAPGALEALFDQAVLADARGDTLAEFARSLRRGSVEAAEVPARSTAVQLLTNHKAKGLEWQAVIQFGLFLKPSFPSSQYPRWQPSAIAGTPLKCFYDKAHAAGGTDGNNFSNREHDTRRAEFERLLYVAITRPRHTLILMDAAALVEKSPTASLAGILGILNDGAARAWWEKLPELSKKSPKKAKASAKIIPVAALSVSWSIPEWSADVFADMVARTSQFTRRVRPSSLARHSALAGAERAEPDLSAPPEFPEEQPAPTAAVAYGNWWHDLMEHTPWAAGRETWTAFWEKHLASAPEPERARAETALLLRSPLAVRLGEPGLEFAAELPFLWAEPNGARAFDGCVDLVVWDAKNSRWLVVDWKTDRVEGGGEELRRRYAAQIEVYARALTAMTNAPAEAFLYGTRAGELTPLTGG